MLAPETTRRLAPLPLLLAAALVSGCGMTPPQGPPSGGPQATTPGLRPGYVPERRHATASLRETWQLAGTTVDIAFIAPESREKTPLLIYLPGLGESAAAGRAWRQAWAEAGYAVLSLQPAELGETAWSRLPAEEGRNAEARDRARRSNLDRRDRVREQYAAPALSRRLALVAQAVAEIDRRAAGQPLYGRADSSHLALAGYDIGAQTAAALAGEQVSRGALPPPLALEAAILLSPHVELAAGTGRARFAAMKLPVLSVTGSEDDDPDGLVGTPALRRTPWQGMPPGDKYLLLLENGIHATLAGSDNGPEGGRRIVGGRQAPPDGQRAMPFGGPPGGGPGGDGGGPETFRRSAAAGTDSRHAQAVQTVTTAFLDAVVRNDPVADEWLRRDATRWLGDSATLWMR